MRIRYVEAAIVAGTVLCGSSVWAQQVRSSDQIVKDLQPTASMLNGPTRGIRPAAPVASPAPANVVPAATSAPTHAPAKAAEPAAPSSSLTVQFQNGSAELTPQAVKALNELGTALSSQSLAGFRFRIEGHTDTVGTREYNMALSEARAKAVAAYLQSKFAIDPKRIEPVGVGSDHLLVPTPAQTPEPRNRRVQVVNLGA
jgi:OOP family OmpA-OmpF porin